MKSVDTSLHHYFFPNINEDGWKFISLLAFLSLILAIIWFPAACFSFLITVWCFYSFRDPVRVTPVLSSAVIAPADGCIIAITREKGPDVLGLNKKNYTKISIYINPFAVNINRIPVKGTISKIFYDAGKTISGSFNKNDINNEKMLFALRHSSGTEFVLQQTSLFCSRRIVDKFKKGDEFMAGQRFGFIRFGSYLDLYLPEKIEPQVCVGQYLIGGETIVADIKSDAPRLEGEIR
ncbi:MAG: phosphatidylserine decarboxylase [Pseudomonadota bacterium]|nr:phosphatidylserine decarboxylase [Pseudomonadota bacterium]